MGHTIQCTAGSWTQVYPVLYVRTFTELCFVRQLFPSHHPPSQPHCISLQVKPSNLEAEESHCSNMPRDGAWIPPCIFSPDSLICHSSLIVFGASGFSCAWSFANISWDCFKVVKNALLGLGDVKTQISMHPLQGRGCIVSINSRHMQRASWGISLLFSSPLKKKKVVLVLLRATSRAFCG